MRDWQTAVDGLSNVQKLVHLAARNDAVDEERYRADLLRVRRRAYEDELTIQAARVGCPGQRGRLGNNASLKALADASAQDAQSIVNTYNYDLAAAVRNLGREVRTANRHTYAKRLGEWDAKRAAWKAGQITQYADSSARALAQQDFYRFNAAVLGIAEMQPKQAQCPVCQGWISRGAITLREALNNPPPYHPSCPHYWVTRPERVAASECPRLWMGQ